MTTTFMTYLLNEPGTDIQFRVMSDGTEQINLWEAGDGSAAEGHVISEQEYLADWGIQHYLDCARREYQNMQLKAVA